jgi:hypothetical protein
MQSQLWVFVLHFCETFESQQHSLWMVMKRRLKWEGDDQQQEQAIYDAIVLSGFRV